MKKSFIILNLTLIQILTINVWPSVADTRQRLPIDNNWKFIQSDVDGAEKQKFDDTKWRTLNLPHDWSIEGEFKEDAITKRSWRLSANRYRMVPETSEYFFNRKRSAILDRI